jgi:putative colanic acid biosynthesis UDP-glucose lipid carrier transferase
MLVFAAISDCGIAMLLAVCLVRNSINGNKQPFKEYKRLLLKLHCSTLNTVTHHTRIKSTPAGKWPGMTQNGIVRSFVASRKKFLFTKRVFDIAFSTIVILLVLSWLTPLLAIIIKLDTKGPVFFRQRRIGRNGYFFNCLKFRTMVQNDEADERPAEENDERITKVGRVLRRINIDELPQFFNVFVGQMSVVGPRPHMIADCIRFSFVISSYSFRSLVRPGITGWAQVNGYHGPTTDYDSIVIRYYWDAMYVRKAGILLDAHIILQTAAHGFASLLGLILTIFHKRTNGKVESMSV